MSETWQTLYGAGVELVLDGHAHVYERFAPQTPRGELDAARGIRQFVVGTGGAPLMGFGAARPNSEVRIADQWGVLELTLHATSFAWRFVTIDGNAKDEGTAPCH